MNVSDYHYARKEEEKPLSADTSVWFSYGDAGKEVYYGVSAKIQEESMAVYALTQTGEVSVTKGNENPIRQDLLGHFIAALPMTEQDIDGDGEAENVYDYARADFGLNAFNPAPQRFLTEEIPFELVFAERKYIMAYYVMVYLIRNRMERNNPAYAIYSRDRVGIYPNTLHQKTNSKFLFIRWLCLFIGMFLWTYAGKLIHQGQTLNEISIPVFSCPFNLDQVVEMPCYYLSHLPALFGRFGADFPERNMAYIVMFLVTTLFCFIFLGRILCGFLCPAGLLQDLMDKLRQALHIRPIVVTDRINRFLQPIKWVWILLFLGFAFAGGDFCDICPLKGFTTAQGGYWTKLYLGGFFAVVILVGSFFIKRFWCIICPMGYLMGLFKRFNLFKLGKDCTSCTEYGACYHACPMRIKSIYTERDKETPSGYPFVHKRKCGNKVNVQTVDCMMCGECIHKCPEDNALSMTFCGKTIYKSSRKTFMSKFSEKKQFGNMSRTF